MPGSLLEKGLIFAQIRQEELENVRFQITNMLSATSGGEPSKESKAKLELLTMSYNNLMYPHKHTERVAFAEDSKAIFDSLKDLSSAKVSAKQLKMDLSKSINFTAGK